MMQRILCGCVVLILAAVSACSAGQLDLTPLPSPSGATLRPNLAQPVSNPVNVLTNHYNIGRTGANLNESILNPSTVNVSQFGKLFTREVEGHIYAQPLYVQGITMPDNRKHNVLYIATMHNWVYAFDADDPNQPDPLWKVNLGTPFTKSVFFDIPGGEVGILSTPVIDLQSQTIYLVSRTQENDNAVYKLNALDIRTGEAKFGSPVVVDLSVPGTGLNHVNGIVHLNTNNQLQRTGLLLLNGYVYLGFGSNNDQGDWFGWLAAYHATTLEQAGIFNTTPNGYQGGIWMGGTGIASDSDYLYFAAANGKNTVVFGGRDYAQSLLKIKHNNGRFEVIDYYTPSNFDDLSNADSGLGSTGVVFIPNTNLMVAGGKDGNLYLVDQNSLGGFDPKQDQSLQIIYLGAGGMFVTPAAWETGPNGKPTVYAWNIEDTIKAYDVTNQNQRLIPQPATESTLKAVGRPVGGLTISSNGVAAETGILWLTVAPEANQNAEGRGALVALDPTDLKHLLWHSDQNRERDELGILSKFASPTVANGKVYVPTFSNTVVVYGLLN